jgi:hypothetical protein
LNRAAAPSPVQFKLISLLLFLSHIAYIYLQTYSGLLAFHAVCVRAACSSRDHSSDAIRRRFSSQKYYLWNDCKPRPQLLQSHQGNVLTINCDCSSSRFNDSKQSQSERGLSGSCPSHDTWGVGAKRQT